MARRALRRRAGALPEGWVGPAWVSSHQRRATPVGTVDGGVTAWVDPRGLVVPAAGGWSLDWWVGAEDGWHIPALEPAARVHQRLLGDVPVVETTMRVPGGEVVQHCYGVRAGADAVVVEIANRSHVPVGLALAVRPYDLASLATLRKVGLDGLVVTAEGRPALQLPKAPAFAEACGAANDVAEAVLAGTRREPSAVADVDDRGGLASLAVVYPLPHTATLRIALAPVGVELAALPPVDAVVRGWEAHLERAMRIEVPDGALQAAVRAALAALLLHAQGDRAYDEPRIVAALERWGFADVVAGLAERRGYRVAPGTELVVPDAALSPRPVADALAAFLHAEPPRGRAAGGVEAAELLLAVRALLLAEPDGGVDVWPLVDPAWLGQGVEVHDAPSARGPVSFAVRWHGARPAVLWDVPAGTTVRAPGLDPSWHSRDAKGEALLAPVEPPGGLPKVYRPLDPGTDAQAATDEPDASFS